MFIRVILELLRALLFLIWLLIGAIFWIPFLARMITVFTISVLASVSRGSSMSAAERGLEAAVKFYLNGFENIHAGINNIIEGGRPESTGSVLSDDDLKSMLIQLGYTFLFWAVFAWLLGLWNMPQIPQAPTSNDDQQETESAPASDGSSSTD